VLSTLPIEDCKDLIYQEIKLNYDPYRVVSLLRPQHLKLFNYATSIEFSEVQPSTDSLHLLVAGVDFDGLIVCPHFMNICREMRFKSVDDLRAHNREVARELRYLCEYEQCKRRFNQRS
jgi:hypothetical protein